MNLHTKLFSRLTIFVLTFLASASSAFAQTTFDSNATNIKGPKVNVGDAAFSTPPVVPTTAGVNTQSVDQTLNLADKVINAVFILLTGVAFIYFILNLIHAMKGEEGAKEKVIRSLIILFVLVAAWGITAYAAQALGVGIGGTGVRLAI